MSDNESPGAQSMANQKFTTTEIHHRLSVPNRSTEPEPTFPKLEPPAAQTAAMDPQQQGLQAFQPWPNPAAATRKPSGDMWRVASASPHSRRPPVPSLGVSTVTGEKGTLASTATPAAATPKAHGPTKVVEVAQSAIHEPGANETAKARLEAIAKREREVSAETAKLRSEALAAQQLKDELAAAAQAQAAAKADMEKQMAEFKATRAQLVQDAVNAKAALDQERQAAAQALQTA